MHRRTLAGLAACLTIVGSTATQMNFGNSHMRIHQHRTAKMQGEQEGDVPACMGQAQEREGQTGKDSVDVRKLSTHLPLVEIETQEIGRAHV